MVGTRERQLSPITVAETDDRTVTAASERRYSASFAIVTRLSVAFHNDTVGSVITRSVIAASAARNNA
jgi:hypothetical protein